MLIGRDVESIRAGLSTSTNIDYYHAVAEFIAPYTLKVQDETIKSNMIFLTIGSKTIIPQIEGLESTGYLTSDSALKLKVLPKSLAIVGGGYIAAEFGHFFATMGSKVTIVGRNERLLPEEEPEISELAKQELGKHIQVLTNHEVRKTAKTGDSLKSIVCIDRKTGKERVIEAEEIMIAAGRGPLTDILHPDKAGIKTTEKGWIQVNEYLETSQPNVWSFGDADGNYLFRHVANYESEVVYNNAVLKRKVKVDYHAIPHAVFTFPEIASVGLREKEVIEKYGKDNVLIGSYKYENTAKGEAMKAKNYFAKVIVDGSNSRILGAHIIGPWASMLIQEIVNVMYTDTMSVDVIDRAIHIHPAMTEVVQRAFSSLMPVEHYHEHIGV